MPSAGSYSDRLRHISIVAGKLCYQLFSLLWDARILHWMMLPGTFRIILCHRSSLIELVGGAVDSGCLVTRAPDPIARGSAIHERAKTCSWASFQKGHDLTPSHSILTLATSRRSFLVPIERESAFTDLFLILTLPNTSLLSNISF